jgi:hypothetical protein
MWRKRFKEILRVETYAQQGQTISLQGQKMELARGQRARPCTLPERSVVEALARLLTLDFAVASRLQLVPATVQTVTSPNFNLTNFVGVKVSHIPVGPDGLALMANSLCRGR